MDTPIYDLTVPSTNKKIKFRPYLVKEQKMLLMANNSDDPEYMINTIKQIISNCTFDSFNVDELPLFDIEYIFLKLRAKSVGEVIETGIQCPNKDCRTVVPVVVNLNEIEVPINKTDISKIQISPSIGIKMKYPTLEVEKKILALGGTDNIVQNYNLLYECIECIYDQNTVYDKKDFTLKDFEEFIENLNSDQFEKILNFFNMIPKVQKEIQYTCPKCNTMGRIKLQGLPDFLV